MPFILLKIADDAIAHLEANDCNYSATGIGEKGQPVKKTIQENLKLNRQR
jgi:hypothetical protein